MNSKSAIGILGGMGPEASAYMYQTLTRVAVREFGVKHNDEFPEIFLYSLPVPDFISDTKHRKAAYDMLKDRVLQCNYLKLSSMSIACNTAHILFDELQQISHTRFISMIDEVAKKVAQSRIDRVGVIGSPVTIKAKLYQSALQNFKIQTIPPNGQELRVIDRIIRHIIADTVTDADRKALGVLAESLVKRGAQGIILGCTELPLIFSKTFPVPVFNCVEILAKTLLRVYYM